MSSRPEQRPEHDDRKRRSRPDVAARRKRNRLAHTSTIKCALRKQCKVEEVVPVIQRAVRAATQVSIEGSRFLNLLLLDLCARGEPLPDVNLTFIRRCFARCGHEASPARDDIIEHAWTHLYAPQRTAASVDGASFPRGAGFGQVLTYAAKDYETSCFNHVKLNFYRRWCACLRRHLLEWAAFLAGRAFKKYASALVGLLATATLCASAEFDRGKLKQAFVQTLKDCDEMAAGADLLAEGLVGYVEQHRTTYAAVLPVADFCKSSNWFKLLPWHYAMMADAAAFAGPEDGARAAKQFSMLPICSLQAKFITIDTDALHGLLRCVGGDEVPSDKSEFRVRADEWWSGTFHVDRLLRTNMPTFTFNRMLKTDGVAANFVFQRPKQPGDVGWINPEDAEAGAALGMRRKKTEWTTPFAQWPDAADVDDNLVTGVDPGRRDLVTAVRPLDPEEKEYSAPSRRRRRHNRRARKHKTRRNHMHGGRRKRKRHRKGEKAFSVSMRQWRADSGSKQAQQRRERWLKRDRRDEATSLYAILQATPSPKVATVEAMQQHIEYILGSLDRVLGHNVDRQRVRRSRFQAYIQRTAALDALCHRLSGGRGKEAVVVLGAAQCSSGFGYFPGPVKELRRRLEQHTRVVVLDEHYTSQRCSKCAFTEKYEESRDKLEPGRSRVDGRRQLHGVRWCPHQDCRTTWNRDVNAARNMRQVFLHMLRHGHRRPAAFRHGGALDATPVV